MHKKNEYIYIFIYIYIYSYILIYLDHHKHFHIIENKMSGDKTFYVIM